MKKPKKDIQFSKNIFGEWIGQTIRVRMKRTFLLLYDNQNKEILYSECSNPIWLLSKLQSL